MKNITQDDRKAEMKEITDRLENGIKELFDSEHYKEYLKVLSKFHKYSFNNTMLIAIQNPNASYVAGYNTWKRLGRYVNKGEKGIRILAPAPIKRKIEQTVIKDGVPVTEEKEVTIPVYKPVSVFDISQTAGKEITDISPQMLNGDIENYKDFFMALEKVSPVPITFESIEGNAHGYFHLTENRIAIDKGMSNLQNIKTVIHEIAHAKLHSIDPEHVSDAGRPDRRTREVQAESVAYAVCQHYGLDTSDYSFSYVANWSNGQELTELKNSLETIRSAASELINEIDNNFVELAKNKETVGRASVLGKLSAYKELIDQCKKRDNNVSERAGEERRCR